MPAPSRPIARGLAGPGLLAHVMVSKFVDHLPLYRQSEIYAREGVDLERSTLADWVGQSSQLLRPLIRCQLTFSVAAGWQQEVNKKPRRAMLWQGFFYSLFIGLADTARHHHPGRSRQVDSRHRSFFLSRHQKVFLV